MTAVWWEHMRIQMRSAITVNFLRSKSKRIQGIQSWVVVAGSQGIFIWVCQRRFIGKFSLGWKEPITKVTVWCSRITHFSWLNGCRPVSAKSTNVGTGLHTKANRSKDADNLGHSLTHPYTFQFADKHWPSRRSWIHLHVSWFMNLEWTSRLRILVPTFLHLWNHARILGRVNDLEKWQSQRSQDSDWLHGRGNSQCRPTLVLTDWHACLER